MATTDIYACDSFLRNDLGILVKLTFDGPALVNVAIMPLRLDYCWTRFATDDDAAWVRHRLHKASADLDVDVAETADELGRVVVPVPRR